MGNDAIRKDGSQEGGEQQQGEQQEPVLSERELALQKIDEELANVPKPLIADEAPVNNPDQPLSINTDQAGDNKPTTMVKVKVDGVEQELPIDEVVRGYQKDAAASRRLQQAAEKERDLERQQAELDQLRAQLKAPSTDQLSKASEGDEAVDADDVDRQIEEAMTALAIGDDERASELMKVLIKGRGKTPTTQQIDIAALTQSVRQELTQEREAADRQSAFDSFLTDNPEFADADSPQRKYGDYLFETTYTAKIERGEISYQAALMQAAAAARKVYGEAVTDGQDVASTRERKRQQKEAIDNIPVAGARAEKAAPAPETVNDTIREMRKARGQIV